MPELPEVETVKEALKLRLLGIKIKDVIIRYEGIIKNLTPEQFKQKIIGQTFREIKRYGKYLIFVFDNVSMVSHLRMEGKYFVKPLDAEVTKHEHIIFILDNNQKLSYQDVRKFGTMEIVPIGEEFDLDSIGKLGKEANDDALNVEYLYPLIHKSSRAIKSLLLDQTILSGLGNIYVDETLFLARLHPETQGLKITKKETAKIIESAKKVLDKAIELGGTTIRTYQSSFGIDGRFQNELNVHTRVGEKCYNCDTVIEKIKVGGRGTYFCPTCQKRK